MPNIVSHSPNLTSIKPIEICTTLSNECQPLLVHHIPFCFRCQGSKGREGGAYAHSPSSSSSFALGIPSVSLQGSGWLSFSCCQNFIFKTHPMGRLRNTFRCLEFSCFGARPGCLFEMVSCFRFCIKGLPAWEPWNESNAKEQKKHSKFVLLVTCVVSYQGFSFCLSFRSSLEWTAGGLRRRSWGDLEEGCK
jgi:hypothetical protein